MLTVSQCKMYFLLQITVKDVDVFHRTSFNIQDTPSLLAHLALASQTSAEKRIIHEFHLTASDRKQSLYN